MKMIDDLITDDKLKIKIHHIGGIGECGPIEALRSFKDDIQWVIYDAEDSSLSSLKTLEKKDHLLINKCIGAINSKGKFNVVVNQSASSMLMPALAAKFYTYAPKLGSALVWGEHTRVVKTVDIDINTLDELMNNQIIPEADFLSVDAQGGELDIINGASGMLGSSIVGVVCEVEFAELYEGQPLFCDIQDRLRKDNFRFCDIYSSMYFNVYPYPKVLHGKGFYTVGEALFLKDAGVLMNELAQESNIEFSEKDVYNVVKLLKIAAIAVAFDQLDFGLKIMQDLKSKKLISLEELVNKTQCNYIKMLLDLSRIASKINTRHSLLASNLDDARSKKISLVQKIRRFFSAIYFLTKTVGAKFIRVLIRRTIDSNIGIYCSPVSRVFYKYGFIANAEKNDRRLLMYHIFYLPRMIKKLCEVIYSE